MRYAREAIIVLLLIIAGALLWLHLLQEKPDVGALVPAKVSDKVESTGKEKVTCDNVEVYEPKAKRDLGLSAADQADKNVHVVAASTVEPDLHQVTIITTFNTFTGQSNTQQRREPYPWMRAEQSGEFRVDYGYGASGPAVRLSVTENLLQIRALHFGVTAAIDTGGSMFAGIGAGYKW